ncbi:MAG: hypothetical protein HY078_16365 [Elusimicrobia bacterium]|nr:hypothetical protein [Elusimicrobiota bacterium]
MRGTLYGARAAALAATLLVSILGASRAQEGPAGAAPRGKAAASPGFDAHFDAIEAARSLKPPEKDWLIDGYMLLRAQRAIVSKPGTRVGPTVSSAEGVRLPAAMFVEFHAKFEGACRKRLRRDACSAYAWVLEEEAAEAAGADIGALVDATNRIRETSGERTAAIRRAYAALLKSTKVYTQFDVPFVAGYSQSGERIYVDREVPQSIELRRSTAPARGLLVVHERFEKTLLEEFKLSYQSAHQLALRLERATALAMGVDWEAYDAAMSELIERIGKRAPKAVPRDLDMTPYLAYPDAESVELARRMKEAMVPVADR